MLLLWVVVVVVLCKVNVGSIKIQRMCVKVWISPLLFWLLLWIICRNICCLEGWYIACNESVVVVVPVVVIVAVSYTHLTLPTILLV